MHLPKNARSGLSKDDDAAVWRGPDATLDEALDAQRHLCLKKQKPADKPVMEPARPLGKLLQTAWMLSTKKLVSRNEFDSKKRFLQSRLA